MSESLPLPDVAAPRPADRRARPRRRRRAHRLHQQHPGQPGADRATRPPRPRPAATPSPAPPVTIGFSAPAADHGWIAAIANNAQAQAAQYPDVTFEAVNPTNDIAQQIAAVETLINKKVSALVCCPTTAASSPRPAARRWPPASR